MLSVLGGGWGVEVWGGLGSDLLLLHVKLRRLFILSRKAEVPQEGSHHSPSATASANELC